MKKKGGVIHVVAECEDCDWRTEEYKNGQAIAANHAKRWKHKVRVDVGLVFEYIGYTQTIGQTPL